MVQSKINNQEIVKNQYKDDRGLVIRKQLHKKYSVNKQGFGDWLFEIMALPQKGKILELGSGNGDFWRQNIHKISTTTTLTLSDFSSGMVEAMQDKFEEANVAIRQIDIQDIPFGDDTFDLVIANAMLYHVPDLEQALAEVHRVLKPKGKFYASTFGENGLSDYISDALNRIGLGISKASNKTFTLQNGSEKLSRHFDVVERLDYKDQLIITDHQDLVDYIFSMTSMHGLTENDRDKLSNYFEAIMNDQGAIEIPKEYGSFVAIKA